jgi:hypothetical protein
MALSQRWTAAVSMGLVLGALLACKKKPDAAAEASATAAPAPAPPAPSAAPVATPAPAPTPAAPAVVEAKLGDVKRYGVDKESKLDDAGVRVIADELKVYNEADTKTDDVATLPKGLLVFRQVKMEDFTLVEFPSGIGQFSQGWVETKALSTSAEKVSRAGALDEKKTATVKVTDAGAPKPGDAGAAKDAGTTSKDAGTTAKDAGTTTKDAGKLEPPPIPDAGKKTELTAAEKAAAEKKAAERKAAAEKKAAEKKAAEGK